MTHDDSLISQQVLSALQTAPEGHSTLSEAQLRDGAAQFVQTWRSYQTQPDTAAAQACGAQLAQLGFGLQAVLRAGRALQPSTSTNGNGSAAAAADTLWQYVGDVLHGYVAATKQAAQQATIAEMQVNQQREDQLRAVIQELSTPIIPIYPGVLVLPLVGAIDSMRSQEITERLLEEIVRQQADMVIIDITGVSVVDTSVANHLIMTAQAVNLLGSKVVFTGISSTIAQTIIQLGVSLGDVVTLSNLQAGMSYALEQLGLGITELTLA